MSQTILTMEHIEKSFPGVHALCDCHFDLRAGEVHSIVGENGAGKSTLMKVLTGVYQKDSGTITYLGSELEPQNPRHTQDIGISIIHQELNLMQHLTCAQNIFIGREPKNARIFTNDRIMNKKTKELFSLLNLKLDPKTRVSSLTVAKQQMVEIAKALSFDSKVLIMDEPTAALSDSEITELFKIIEDLKKRGVGIVYISHRMDELMKITDRITVMRDGQYINTVNTKDVNKEEIINMMVGRTIFEEPKTESTALSDEIVLSVQNLSDGGLLKDISFDLKHGEILGFAGLMGAGRTEVMRALFGADKKQSGDIFIRGRLVKISSPKDAVKHGIGYLSEDRKRYGMMVGMNVETNTVIASMEKFNNLGVVDTHKTAKVSEEYVKKLKTKTPSIRQIAKNLSGGNQQKVIIAKWLVKDCDILIFDEPTRGIDIGAKSEIYSLLSELAKSGKSIIMISSELPEILRMSDRVAVMCEGRITKILDIKDANQETIMHYATLR